MYQNVNFGLPDVFSDISSADFLYGHYMYVLLVVLLKDLIILSLYLPLRWICQQILGVVNLFAPAVLYPDEL